jgi:hypothetical protein
MAPTPGAPVSPVAPVAPAAADATDPVSAPTAAGTHHYRCVSYDITLVRRRPGQSWDDAFEHARQHGDVPLRPEQYAQLSRIQRRVTEIVGEIESASDATEAELTDMATGLQVHLFAHEASVTYPYWEQPDPDLFHRRVAGVVAVVEEETGLSAYDEQSGEAFDGRIFDADPIAFVRTLHAREAAAAAGQPWPDDHLPSRPGRTAPDSAGAYERVGTAPTQRPGPAVDDARSRRRALRYLVTGVVILAVAVPLLVRNPDPSFFSYFAVVIGAVDTVVGAVLWGRRRR